MARLQEPTQTMRAVGEAFCSAVRDCNAEATHILSCLYLELGVIAEQTDYQATVGASRIPIAYADGNENR